eukprot:10658943-Lingulodinium_polyedra.AAC.1
MDAWRKKRGCRIVCGWRAGPHVRHLFCARAESLGPRMLPTRPHATSLHSLVEGAPPPARLDVDELRPLRHHAPHGRKVVHLRLGARTARYHGAGRATHPL